MRAVERILPLLPAVLKGFLHPIKSLQQPIKNNNILYIDNIKILVESYKYTIRNKNARLEINWKLTSRDGVLIHSKSETIGGVYFSGKKLAERVRKSRQQNFATNVRKS